MVAVNELENFKHSTPEECKAINTFIDESVEKKIQDMCKDVYKEEFVNLKNNWFDCEIKDKKKPCSYTQEKPNKNKKIKCEYDNFKDKFLPVHLEAGSAEEKTQQLIPV